MISTIRTLGLSAVFAACLVLAGAPSASAGCVNKAGSGTGGNVDSAKFQAYEAVLQATSWGMWSQWMASSQKIGVAPGYKVSNVKSSCKNDGLGKVCVIQATLCN